MKKYIWNKEGKCTNPDIVYKDVSGLHSLQIMLAQRLVMPTDPSRGTVWLYGYRVAHSDYEPLVANVYAVPTSDDKLLPTYRNARATQTGALLLAIEHLRMLTVFNKLPDGMRNRLRRYEQQITEPSMFQGQVFPVKIQKRRKPRQPKTLNQ